MTTFDTGRTAETAIAEYLGTEGFEILAQNWRTRVCEVDVIARKARTVYFVEVKYRKTNAQGGGLEYITASKLKQMHFAAELWVAQNDWRGDYQLAAAEVSGEDFEITDFIESI